MVSPSGASGERMRIADLDKSHVWHPFTQMDDWCANDQLVIERAEGFELIDVDGKRYLDGNASLWVNVHGHRVPEIDAAIRAQLGRVAHATLLGLAGVPSAQLAAKLVGLAPDGLTRVFYSDAGATAVEIALKMAFGYWKHRGAESKRTFVCLENAYHGDTVGAVSVGGMDLFHAEYGPLLFDAHRVPMGSLNALDSVLASSAQDVCAVIVEPLVQGAAGMLIAPDGYLRGVRELCDRYDVLLIADEVATGFGRTGTMFACEQEDVRPDLLCVGKGLTGGYLPLAATLATDAVFDAFRGGFDRTFFHGHTYTGNALGCAAAIANLDLMASSDTLGHVREMTSLAAELLKPLRDHPRVADVRQRGLMIGIELGGYDPALRTGARACRMARDHGVIIRPLGDVIVLMPPLMLPEPDLRRLIDVTAVCIDALGD